MNKNTANPVYLTRDQLINNTPNAYKNRPATEADLEQMKQWLDNYAQTIKINQADTGIGAEAILQMVIKLGITMPPELKLLYSCVGNCPNLITPAGVKKMDYKLLSVDELAVKKEIEVLNFYADADEV